MWILLIALIAMAISDFTDACSTVAESRGKGRLAGLFTAADNTLSLFVAVVGADTLITKGWGQALVLGACVFAVTFVTTDLATTWACKRVGSTV